MAKTFLTGHPDNKTDSSPRAQVFALMLELARDTQKHYLCDLYYAAHNLMVADTVLGTWYFVARENGAEFTRNQVHAIQQWRVSQRDARLWAIHVTRSERTDSYYAHVVAHTPVPSGIMTPVYRNR